MLDIMKTARIRIFKQKRCGPLEFDKAAFVMDLIVMTLFLITPHQKQAKRALATRVVWGLAWGTP